MKELYVAFLQAQREIKVALKDSRNPHFKSTYADLESVWESCKDALHKNGIAVMQLTDLDASGVPVLVTRLVHESGQHVEGRYPILSKDPSNPQAQLAALTYARRGCLAAACGVIQSDDDGNSAAGHTAPLVKASPPSVQPQAKTPPSPMVALFEAHQLKYPQDLELVLGKKVPEWGDNEKVLARQAVEELKKGTPWSVIAKKMIK